MLKKNKNKSFKTLELVQSVTSHGQQRAWPALTLRTSAAEEEEQNNSSSAFECMSVWVWSTQTHTSEQNWRFSLCCGTDMSLFWTLAQLLTYWNINSLTNTVINAGHMNCKKTISSSCFIMVNACCYAKYRNMIKYTSVQ